MVGGWDAAWFILTGQTPFVFPLKVEVTRGPGAKGGRFEKPSGSPSDVPFLEYMRLRHAAEPNTATITIKAEPWVQEERIKNYYRRIQKQLTGNSRDSWERNLGVYNFVKHWRSKRVDDSRLPALWNEEMRQDWRYKGDNGFWQAYGNARRSVEERTFNELER